MYRVRVCVGRTRAAAWLPLYSTTTHTITTTALRHCSTSPAPHEDTSTREAASEQPARQPIRTLYPLDRPEGSNSNSGQRGVIGTPYTHGRARVALRDASRPPQGQEVQGSHELQTTAMSSSSSFLQDEPQHPPTSSMSYTGTGTGEEEGEAQEKEVNEVTLFRDEMERQVAQSHYERNQSIPLPPAPAALIPPFRRLKKHTPMQQIAEDADLAIPHFTHRDTFLSLPPATRHPWVPEAAFGPHIVHGDGYMNGAGPIVGTGEVGFEDDPHCVNSPSYQPARVNTSLTQTNAITTTTTKNTFTGGEEEQEEVIYKPGCVLPKDFRGLQPRSPVMQRLPQDNGKVLQTLRVQYSFGLTGRGLFATQPIAPGEILMIVQSTAQCVGVMSDVERLEEMCIEVLRHAATSEESAARDFLHRWIFTGQPSSLLECWPAAATRRVVRAIGGEATLYKLELHPIHIARLAAVIDLNSFLVESTFASRKGMAYFPEAGFLNHSCAPNATYDILPEHTFAESVYYADEVIAQQQEQQGQEGEHEDEAKEAFAKIVQQVEVTKKKRKKRDRDVRTQVADRTAAELTVGQMTSSLQTRNAAYLADLARSKADLTSRAAPTYLFCCRATQPIAAGEEVLISYVPPSWSFDNRQYVLHDRYHFWCKCAKCAPTLDHKSTWVPRFTAGLVLCVVALQLLMRHARDTTGDRMNRYTEEDDGEEGGGEGEEGRREYYDGRVLYDEGDRDVVG